jgi:AcrR family transcriptional regulator
VADSSERNPRESPEPAPRESPEPAPPKSPKQGPSEAPQAQLPRGLDILWGKRDRGQRGPKPGLTVDAIVDAAIAIADTGGLEAVSMASVAKRLGFTTMSLYRYVTNKDELLQLMWNGSARGAESLVLTGEGWRARLRDWSVIQRDMLDRHPWITQMPMASPPMAPNSLAFVERGLEALDGTGLTDPEKIRVIGLLSSYSLSEARMAYDALRAGAAAPEQPSASFELILRLLVDKATYPRLHRLAWSTPTEQPQDERAEFLHGIDCILDGVQALIERATGNT